MKKERIFFTNISVGPYRRFIDEIISLTNINTSSYICFANAHMIVEAYEDKDFNAIVNGADLVAPDGKPLSIFLRIANGIKQERICGMDILPDLLQEAERLGKSVYFYGNTNEMLKSVIDRTSLDFPLLHIAGYYSPPFRELSSEEKTSIINRINMARPDLLLVSLGCPKQEKWMAEHRYKINSCMLGLGQAFNTYTGKEKRIPVWMRDLSLEWAYRLYLEPRRLWKRYLYSNSMFLFLAFLFLVKKWFSASELISDETASQKPSK